MVTIERRQNRLGLALLAGALVAGGIAVAVSRSGSGSHTTAPGSTAPPSSTPLAMHNSITLGFTTPTTVASVAQALPSKAGLLVFGLTQDNVVLRVDIDARSVIRIPTGPRMSTAPTFLAVGPAAVLVRPYDNVQGYVVADDGTVTPSRGALDGGASLTCSDGRRSGVWMARQVLMEVGYDGSTKTLLDDSPRLVPRGCDGQGGIVYELNGSTFVTNAGGPRLVTNGSVLAAGGGFFLVRDCDGCGPGVVELTTDTRTVVTRPLPIQLPNASLQEIVPMGPRVGSVSPDGRTAVVFLRGDTLAQAPVIDLVSGETTMITVAAEPQAAIWSPDSRYLIYISDNLELTAFDRTTRAIVRLGVSGVVAIAGRPT